MQHTHLKFQGNYPELNLQNKTSSGLTGSFAQLAEVLKPGLLR